MQNKTYNIEMTAEDITTVYSFFKMSWSPQDCETTDHISPLEEKITKIYNEIAAEIKGKVCRTCQHYDEPAGCLCNKHGMRLRSTTAACVSYTPKEITHP